MPKRCVRRSTIGRSPAFRALPLLAGEPRVVLAEVPFYPRQAVFENAEYVLNSTAHWRPLMNGYSGYTPASYVEFADVFWYFPRDYAIDAMQRAGVTHVMVHPERLGLKPKTSSGSWTRGRFRVDGDRLPRPPAVSAALIR